MTKRLKVYLLTLVAAACLACTLAGCKIGGLDRSELLAGYNTHVTYYSNGGAFDGSTSLTVRELYFKGGDDGAPFFEITSESRGMKVESRGADELVGWYLPARYTLDDAPAERYVGEIKYEYTYTPDANDPSKPAEKLDSENPNNVTVPVFPVLNERGNPLTDSATDRPVFARMNNDTHELLDEQILERYITVVCSDHRVESGTMIPANRDDPHGLIVCAKWMPVARIHYILVITDEFGNEITDDDTEWPTADGKETFKNGSELVSYAIAGESEMPQSTEQKKLSGLTFVKTFPNRDLTGELTAIAHPEDPDEEEPKVWCRYILGDWDVVRTSADVRNMFAYMGSRTQHKFLILNDIAYTGNAINARLASARAANAVIVCDGGARTISGLKFNVPRADREENYSIFGTIGGDFSVSGLTLRDIGITITSTNQNFYFYAVCGSVNGEGETPANPDNIDITIENITATYAAEMENRFYNDDLEDHWIFGSDDDYATDSDFLAQFTGVKLTGTNTLTALQP